MEDEPSNDFTEPNGGWMVILRMILLNRMEDEGKMNGNWMKDECNWEKQRNEDERET